MMMCRSENDQDYQELKRFKLILETEIKAYKKILDFIEDQLAIIDAKINNE